MTNLRLYEVSVTDQPGAYPVERVFRGGAPRSLAAAVAAVACARELGAAKPVAVKVVDRGPLHFLTEG